MGKIRVSSSSAAGNKAGKPGDALVSHYGKVGISAVAAALAVRGGRKTQSEEDKPRKTIAKR